MKKIPESQVQILGAGASAAIAAGALASYQPCCFEADKEKTILEGHKAVLRIRDPRTALLLGCSIREITVQKMIWMDGEFSTEPSILANNLYSLKTNRTIAERSLQNLGFCKRYAIEGADKLKPNCTVYYQHEAERIVTEPPLGRGFIHFKNGLGSCPFDILISTIPLPSMLAMTGMMSWKEAGDTFRQRSIFVCEGEVQDIPVTTNQTIYFPHPDFATYRATLEEGMMRVESTRVPEPEELCRVCDLFGLDKMKDVIFKDVHEQKGGKLIPAPEDLRQEMIYQLTDRFGIFSLGRFAIWKPIRIDEALQDMEQIKRMIPSKLKRHSYTIARERVSTKEETDAG